MLISLLLNNRRENHRIYLLHSGLQPEDINSLSLFIRNIGNAELLSINVNELIVINAPEMKWWSREMYYRLFAADIIAEKRALWLDADIIVNSDISSFYYQDLEGNCLCVCRGNNQTGVGRLQLPKDHIYFNSGVLLMDLERIREHYNKSDFIRCLEMYCDVLEAPDQDVLNIVFHGKTKYEDERLYNHEVFGFSVIDKAEVSYIYNDAKIIHYNGPIKPWNYKGANWADKLWWRYELKRRRYFSWIKYMICNTPVKAFYCFRELYYIIRGQLLKLC